MDGTAKKLSGRLPAWLAVGMLGMFAIALSSGLQPWAAAVAGGVVPADLAADAAAGHLFVQRISPYDPAIRVVHERLTGLPLVHTLPYFPHPPFSLMITWPFGLISFQAASLAWFAATMALLLALAVLIREATFPGARRPAVSAGTFFLLLLAWPPVLYNLEKGQWSVLVAVLLAAAWRPMIAGNLRNGAVWVGMAASVKVFPVVLGAYLLLRSVRAATWFAATGIALLIPPLMWLGFGAFPDYIRESRLNLPYWESFPLVMFSVHGAITRALVGGRWAEPLIHAPVAAKLLEGAVIALLLGAAILTTLHARKGLVTERTALLVWMVLLPILNPLSMGHNGVLLALPLAVLAAMLETSGTKRQRWAWALALVLVSVPHQTVWRFAAPPVGPVEGLAIAALPTWGALILFAMTVSVARAERVAALGVGSGKIESSPASAHSFTADGLARAEPFQRIPHV